VQFAGIGNLADCTAGTLYSLMLQSPKDIGMRSEGGYDTVPLDQAQREDIDILNGYYMHARFGNSEMIKINWSRDGPRLKSDNLRRGCRLQAQCRGRVRTNIMSLLIVAAGERRGSLGVGFENMMRSWVMK